jgi:hypothetical protein
VTLAAAYVVGDRKGRLSGVRAELVSEAVGRILLVSGVIGVSAHRAVEVDGRKRLRHEGAVNWYLVQVHADAVVLRVSVEEHAELEQGIGRVANTGHHASGGERRLLDVAVEVLRVLVKHKTTEFMHGELVTGPDLGHVEGVESELLRVSLLGLHYLNLGSPFHLLPTLNGFPQITLRIVGVNTAYSCSFDAVKLLLSVLGNKMVLDIDEFALLVDPPESMAAVAVVESPADGCAVIAEKHQAGMVSLRRVSQEVEESILVQQEVLWGSVLGADNIWSLDGIPAEENRKVQSDKVIVALLGVELDGKASWVSRLIRKFSSQSDSGETNEDGRLFALLL